ncbi:MAG TPA: MBL fold metallo-hydrolase, partial [Trebonia sp.]|nr:MBL fold metallo-hydrolase [Trebonia sp.]
MPESAPRPEVSRRRLLAGAAAIPVAAVAVAAASRPAAAAATSANGTMLLTWLGHSCFRLEKDGFVAVIDPGIVAPGNALDDADAVLITHQHADHFLPSLIAGRIKTRPG